MGLLSKKDRDKVAEMRGKLWGIERHTRSEGIRSFVGELDWDLVTLTWELEEKWDRAERKKHKPVKKARK